jgi:predicted N-acetyltransferase YhbS
MSAIAARPSNERPPLTVRAAEPAERDAVLAVMEAANAEHRSLMQPEVYDHYLRNLRDLVTADRGVQITIAGLGLRLVGAVAFIADAGMSGDDRHRRWATLRALAVDPAVRGAGIGQRLVGWCIGQARQHDAPAIYLHSAIFQATAHRLYERLGFKRMPERDLDTATGCRDIPVTPGVPHLLAYWKKLG